MNTSENYGLKLYEGTDLFNPLTVENVNFETLDEVLKAISDRAVGNATELKTATVHALTRTGNTDADTFVFTATSNFTAGDTFTLDGVQVSALTVAGSQLSTGAYVIGSSVLVHVRDTLLTFYVSETTAQDAERLGGELPSYYAQASALNDVIADVTALATKVGTAVLTTQAQDCSGAINELNSDLSNKVGKTWTNNVTSDALSYALDGTPKMLNCSIIYTISNIQHVSTITIAVRGNETGSTRFVAGGANVYVQLDVNWDAKTYTTLEMYNGQTVPTYAVIWDWR